MNREFRAISGQQLAKAMRNANRYLGSQSFQIYRLGTGRWSHARHSSSSLPPRAIPSSAASLIVLIIT